MRSVFDPYYLAFECAILAPIGTSDSNPVLLMFDLRTGLKWSQRLPLKDCFEQLKMDFSKMVIEKSSIEVSMCPRNGKIVANVKGGGRWKYNLSFIYDLDGNLLKSIVLPNDCGIYIDDSGKRCSVNAKVRKIVSRKADGSVEQSTAYDYFLIDTDKDQAIRFDPGDNVYLTDTNLAYDQGHFSGLIAPDKKMTAIFETKFKD